MDFVILVKIMKKDFCGYRGREGGMDGGEKRTIKREKIYLKSKQEQKRFTTK